MDASFLKSVLLILFAATASFSCDEKRADHSRTVDAYISSGMPDPSAPWKMEDYTQARNVLTKIKWEQPLELPVKDSEKSGALFEHMVSLGYLSFLQDSTLTLNEKAERISEFTRVYDYWMDVYTIPILQQDPYERERLELQIFNMRLMEAMVDLMHKINESDEPADAGLKYGHQFIIGNYLSSLRTNLRIQQSPPALLHVDIERMADSIYASVMRNKGWMDSAARADLRRSLHSVINSTSSADIRQKYSGLVNALSSSSTEASQ